jgi:hypothetical protein
MAMYLKKSLVVPVLRALVYGFFGGLFSRRWLGRQQRIQKGALKTLLRHGIK